MESEEIILFENVCREVLFFMRQNHITYDALAQKLGITPQAISNRLRRSRLFSFATASQWAKAFKELGYPIDPSFLVTGMGPLAINPAQDYRDTNHSYFNSDFSDKRLKMGLSTESTVPATEEQQEDWESKAKRYKQENESLRKIIVELYKIIGLSNAE